MSHRVSIQTQITNGVFAKAACEAAGFSYSYSNDTIRLTSGPAARATINLKTGEISGDSDFHKKSHDSLGVLKRHYAEQVARHNVSLNGHIVVGRTVDQTTGEITLQCQSFG